ncbi:MAG: hypothetical protein LBK52_00210 [Deltaproteobacteria bacterium]|jgi:hypothetical protein|nr:hypothetical protein [Deltaproteobacteria bacterium]
MADNSGRPDAGQPAGPDPRPDNSEAKTAGPEAGGGSAASSGRAAEAGLSEKQPASGPGEVRPAEDGGAEEAETSGRAEDKAWQKVFEPEGGELPEEPGILGAGLDWASEEPASAARSEPALKLTAGYTPPPERTSPYPALFPEFQGTDQNWLWIMAAPITVHREKLLILSDGNGDYIPVFLDRIQARSFMDCLDPNQATGYEDQAMHQADIESLAREMAYRMVLLDGRGHILASLAAPEKRKE